MPPPAGGPPTLAERLSARGYATGAFVSAFVLDRRFGLARGFDAYDDGPFTSTAKLVSMGTLERRCEATVAAALAWARDAPRPLFLWVHLFDPHAPYDAPAPFGAGPGASSARAYDGEIEYTDHCAGQLLDGLAAAGLDDDALVVAVGDHGEGLGEHGESTHGVFVYESTLHVPLIVASLGSGGAARAVPEPVRTVDLAPTLLEIAGADPLPGADGISLAPLLSGSAPGPARPQYAESLFGQLHFGWAPLASLAVGATKLVEAPRPELYDLAADPGERRDLAATQPTDVARMRAALEDVVAGMGPPLASAHATDSEALEKLAALGYVGAGGPVAGSGADPKDKVGVAEALVEARRALEHEATRAEGAARLERLLEREPDLVDAQFLLGWARLEEGRDADAAARFGRTLELNPRYPLASYHLGLALERAGDAEGAIAAFEAALEVDPRHGDALVHRAGLHAAAGRLDRALADYRAALVLAPEAPLLRAKLGGLLLRMQRFDEAERELREAARLKPGIGVVHFNLALLAERAGRAGEAIAEYRRAIEADPGDIKPLVNLASLLGARGEPREAERLLERALALDPGFAPARAMLERARRAGRERP